MSNASHVHDAGGTVTLTAPDGNGFPRELAPETTAALVVRAKDILTGRTQPPALVVPPEVEQLVQQEFGGCQPPPTAEAVRRIAERHHLEARYGGQPVACYTTPTGTLAVLASGDQEIEALLRGLSDEERSKVVVTDTEPL